MGQLSAQSLSRGSLRETFIAVTLFHSWICASSVSSFLEGWVGVSPLRFHRAVTPLSPPCSLLKLSQACFYLVTAGMCRCMRGGHHSSRPAMALPWSSVNAAKTWTCFPTHAAFVPFIREEWWCLSCRGLCFSQAICRKNLFHILLWSYFYSKWTCASVF